MKLILTLLILFGLSSCTYFEPKDLKSPCVALPSQDGSVTPCTKRNVNDNWLA